MIGIHPQALISHFKPIANHKQPIHKNKTRKKQPTNSRNLFAVFSPIDPGFGPLYVGLLHAFNGFNVLCVSSEVFWNYQKPQQ